jgi:hypothetical protein
VSGQVFSPQLKSAKRKSKRKRRGRKELPESRRSTRLSAEPKNPVLKWVFRLLFSVALVFVIVHFFPEKDTPLGKQIYPAVEASIAFWDTLSADALVDPGPGAGGSNARFKPTKPGELPGAPANDPDGQGAAVDTASDSDTDTVGEAPPDVTIRIVGIPPYAEVFLEGKRTSNPIVLPKSSKRMRLDIIATDLIPLNVSMVPDKDQTLKLTMKKISKKNVLKRN